MGTTEQEQAEAMKRYIREVVIPEYAKNFNKGLSVEDIKFYGKIHFDRDRSDNEFNMHCHLIVSRKDQFNKLKISPLTNHRNTKKGAIKGGFDRSNLFQQVEQGFDKLFDYQRSLAETFEYCNVMKNGRIEEQLKMQEREINVTGEKGKEEIGICADKQVGIAESVNQAQTQDLSLSSALGIFAPEVHGENEDDYIRREEEKKKKRRGLRR